MLLSSHSTSSQNVNHAEKTLMRLVLYLLMEKEHCIYAAFRIDLPATHIVLKIEAHRSIRGAKAVSMERMPLESILWHMHPVNLSHRIPHFLDLILQHISQSASYLQWLAGTAPMLELPEAHVQQKRGPSRGTLALGILTAPLMCTVAQ